MCCLAIFKKFLLFSVTSMGRRGNRRFSQGLPDALGAGSIRRARELAMCVCPKPVGSCVSVPEGMSAGVPECLFPASAIAEGGVNDHFGIDFGNE